MGFQLTEISVQVHLYTAHYDPNRCFPETKSGAFEVRTAGSWFPRSIMGRCIALCAYIRCILVSFWLSWTSKRSRQEYDVIIVDQVSAVIPFLSLLTKARILFYCHFPDLLLASRRSTLHSLYRKPLDWIEETTTGMSDCVLVNSGFTKEVFGKTFPRLAKRGIKPEILYPAVHIPSDKDLENAEQTWKSILPDEVSKLIDSGPTFVSINRFERKKGIPLALQALHQLVQEMEPSSSRKSNEKDEPSFPNLIIAGGFDRRLAENVEHLEELKEEARKLSLNDSVGFLTSFSDEQRAALLAKAVAILYTPPDEHFGIVPLEAMAAKRPVIACNSGGPLESILDGETGILCNRNSSEWATAMAKMLNKNFATTLGMRARHHVKENFSRDAFGGRLDQIIMELVSSKCKKQ